MTTSTEIKTWQERQFNHFSAEVFSMKDDSEFMELEIAELRAALEAAQEEVTMLRSTLEVANAALEANAATRQRVANSAPVSQPVGAVVADELYRIGELLRTQNNRYTDQPMFIVQQKHTYVTEEGYNDSRIEWVTDDGDYTEASPLRAQRLEALYRRKGETLEGWRRFSVHDVWEFVTACFTEQGCKDYLKRNGQNLKEARIYANGSYRNEEFRAVRNWLISLDAAIATQTAVQQGAS